MINVSHLSKAYGGRVVVDNVSFSVEPGRVTGFLGPNGSGKSTTIRMILGIDTPLHTPDQWRAEINGSPYRSLTQPLRHVGSVLDASDVHPGRTAHSHLRIIAASNNLPESRVPEVLERTGLTKVARQRIGRFSLGMRQRLAIAVALLGDPPVLIFDEPVNGLDPEGILWIRNLMKSAADEGRTVFVSSHLMSEMAVTADHLIVLGRGRVVADMGVADFITRSGLGDILVRSPRGPELTRLLNESGGSVATRADGALLVTDLDITAVSAIAADHQVPIHELTNRQPSLEEAYMKLTESAVEYAANGPTS